MKVTYTTNTLTIDTEVKVDAIDTKAKVTDEKGNDIYTIVKGTDHGMIGENFIQTNAVTSEDTLALVIAVGAGKSIEDLKKEYADLLLAADKGIKAVAEVVAAKKAAVDSLFAEISQ